MRQRAAAAGRRVGALVGHAPTSGMADSPDAFRIELLGPVEAWVDGRPVALGGPRPRALFAVLALMGGHVVATDRLIDELWGEEPPTRARDSLQMHISRLRKGLAEAGADDGRLVSHAGGYLLELRPGERDVDRWQRTLARARQARADGDALVGPEGDRGGARRLARPAARGRRPRTACSRRSARGSRRSAWPRSSRGSSSTSSWAATASCSGSWRRWSSRIRSRSVSSSCRCWRSIAADGRPTRWRPSKPRARRFVEELGIEPAQPLRELHEDVLKHAAALSPARQTLPVATPRPTTPSALSPPQVAGAAQPHDRSRPTTSSRSVSGCGRRRCGCSR